MGGSHTGDQVDWHLCFTLLPSSLSKGSEMSLTGLNNISGLGRHKGTIRVSSGGGGDWGNGHVSEETAEVGGDNVGGSHTGDQVDGHLGLTLLPSGLSNGSKVSLTGLNDISGLGRHKGTVGMSSEGGSDWGNGHMSEEATEVGGDNMGGSHTGDQVDGHLCFTLLPSSLSNGSEVG